MELAGRFARTVYEPYRLLSPASDNLPSLALVVETLRIAGLLHDIGHGPFSHLLDECVLKPKFNLTHERIGAHIIQNHLGEFIRRIRRTPDGEEFAKGEQIDPTIVANLIQKDGERSLPPLWKALSKLIRGSYDADKMDFLLRDGAACGLQGFDKHEVERLIYTSFLGHTQDGPPVLLLDSSSRLALLAFLRQRQYLTEAVYYHRTVRALEYILKPCIKWVASQVLQESPLQNLEAYFAFDEYALFQKLSEAAENMDETTRKYRTVWKQAIERQIPWKQVFELVEPQQRLSRVLARASSDVKDLIVERYKEQSASEVDEQHFQDLNERIFVDIAVSDAPEALLGGGVLLYDRRTDTVVPLKPQELEREGVVPHLVFLRVYAHEQCTPEQKSGIFQAARNVFALDTAGITSY